VPRVAGQLNFISAAVSFEDNHSFNQE
jgi:hypothetical protein